MVTQAEISQQREAFTRAQQRVSAAQASTPQITQQMLRRQTQQPLTAREQRRQIISRTEELKETGKQLVSQAREFERDVARKAPRFARPEFRQEAIQRAKQSIRNKITELLTKAGDVETAKARSQLNQQARALESVLRRSSDTDIIKFAEAGAPLRLETITSAREVLIPGRAGEFSQAEIGSTFQQSIAPEALTDRQRGILRGKRFFAELSTRGESRIDLTKLPPEGPVLIRAPGPLGRLAPSFISPRQAEFAIERGREAFGRQTNIELEKLGASFQVGISPIDPVASFTQRKIVREEPRFVSGGEAIATAADVGTFLTPVVGPARVGIAVGATAERLARKEPVSTTELVTGGALLGLSAIAPAVRGVKALRARAGAQERIVRVGLPKAEQIVVFSPKLKKEFIETAPGVLRVVEKDVGLVITRTDTGLLRIITERGVAPKVTPVTQISVGGTVTKEGLFRSLTPRQAATLEPSTIQRLFGREFAKTAAKGRINIGGAITTESFVAGTKVGEEAVVGRGIARVRTTQPRVQRTGEVKGTFEELQRGTVRVGGEDVPLRQFEGVTTFRPLFRAEPTSLARVRTTVFGSPGQASELFSIRELLPQVQIRAGAQAAIIQPVLAEAPVVAEVAQPVISRVITQAPRAAVVAVAPLARPSDFLGPIPQEQLGVFDIPIQEQVVEFRQPQLATVVSPAVTQVSLSRSQIKSLERQAELQQQKSLQAQKSQLKQLERLATATGQTQRFETIQKQMQGQLLKQAQALKSLSKSRPGAQQAQTLVQQVTQRPRVPIPIVIPEGPPLPEGMKEMDRKLTKEFKLLIKKAGKFQQFGTGTRAQVLRRGQKTVKETLAATFKIEETGKLIKGKREKVAIDKAFRTFKIVKGKKVPLVGVFIQKRGTRLGSFGEVKAIQRARKKKVKRKKR